jgi:hypothetical protein
LQSDCLPSPAIRPSRKTTASEQENGGKDWVFLLETRVKDNELQNGAWCLPGRHLDFFRAQTPLGAVLMMEETFQ